MIEVEGDAAFEAFPGESFRFGVEHADGVGEIWLENQSSRKRWKCEVTDVEEFAPADVVLPQKTVLHYVAASLRDSAAANAANFGPKLVREDNDETLRLEVLIKLGVADFAWAPKYIFSMSLVARSPPSIEAQAEQITVLTTQVQELQQEVNTLKQQMQTMLKAQATAASAPTRSNVAHSTPPSLPPAPVEPGNVVVMESEATVSTPSRTDKVWSDIIGQSHHKLVQTDEFRETRNPLGMTMRSHRQHTCKVCSVLCSNRKRAALSSRYCRECTERHNGGMVFLCDRARPHDPEEYRNATCSQIWHLMWNNGENIPQTGKKSSIRMRKKLKTDSE